MKFKKIIIICLSLFAFTIQASASIKEPENVAVDLIGTRSALLTWENVHKSNNPDYYRIRTYCGNKLKYSDKITTKLSKDNNSDYLNRLKPNSNCKVKIRTVRDYEKSDWVEVTFQTITKKNKIKKYKVYDLVAHAETESGSISTIKKYSKKWGLKKSVLMPTPMALAEKGTSQSEEDLLAFTASSANYKVCYGGAALNPILNALYGEMELTEEEMYPNGLSVDKTEGLAATQAYRDDPAAAEEEFMKKATEVAESGDYACFGELAPFHQSLRENHPYQKYPADNKLMLWLSDLASENNMYLVLHGEPDEETVKSIENLCQSNLNTKIIWDHVGWYEEGDAEVKTYQRMLKDNKNLYLLIKQREPEEYGDYFPLNDKGRLQKNWKNMILKYKNRIMVETDNKYWLAGSRVKDEYTSHVEPLFEFLDQLPKKAAQQLSYKNAKVILGL